MDGVCRIYDLLREPQQLYDIVTKPTLRWLTLLICFRMAAAADIFDFPDETDRLLAIQTTVEVALQKSKSAVHNVNVSKG